MSSPNKTDTGVLCPHCAKFNVFVERCEFLDVYEVQCGAERSCKYRIPGFPTKEAAVEFAKTRKDPYTHKLTGLLASGRRKVVKLIELIESGEKPDKLLSKEIKIFLSKSDELVGVNGVFAARKE